MMNRAAPGVALLGLFIAFCSPPAKAGIEFCPASLTIRPVGMTSGQPAATYGFILKASGPRNLIATLTFDTDKRLECNTKQLELAAHADCQPVPSYYSIGLSFW